MYINERSYTITLTVKDGRQTSSASQPVTVYKKPTVNFSFSPVKGCAPFPVSFAGNWSAGDGAIAKYLWGFGDGITAEGANLQQTTHTNNTASSQTAILTVINSYGCHATSEQPGIIILQPIQADFSIPKTHCAPLTNRFYLPIKVPDPPH